MGILRNCLFSDFGKTEKFEKIQKNENLNLKIGLKNAKSSFFRFFVFLSPKNWFLGIN